MSQKMWEALELVRLRNGHGVWNKRAGHGDIPLQTLRRLERLGYLEPIDGHGRWDVLFVITPTGMEANAKDGVT